MGTSLKISGRALLIGLGTAIRGVALASSRSLAVVAGATTATVLDATATVLGAAFAAAATSLWAAVATACALLLDLGKLLAELLDLARRVMMSVDGGLDVDSVAAGRLLDRYVVRTTCDGLSRGCAVAVPVPMWHE